MQGLIETGFASRFRDFFKGLYMYKGEIIV